RRTADRRARLEGVRGTCRARARAVLGHVAHARGGAADGGAGLEAVGRTIVVAAVAAFDHVADASRRTADRGALAVRRTGSGRPGAVLSEVADTRRPPTHRGARLEAVRRTGRGRPG